MRMGFDQASRAAREAIEYLRRPSREAIINSAMDMRINKLLLEHNIPPEQAGFVREHERMHAAFEHASKAAREDIAYLRNGRTCEWVSFFDTSMNISPKTLASYIAETDEILAMRTPLHFWEDNEQEYLAWRATCRSFT